MTVALFVPRYFMIAGIAVLAFELVNAQTKSSTTHVDLEQLLPLVIRDFVPVGLTGLLIAGLLAAFMSTFSGTINAAAAYLTNDVYKRYLRPNASDRQYIAASYVASLLVVVAGCAAGVFMSNVKTPVDWIVSGLWGGYAAANVLKWHWWRLNGWGYFWGMITGISGAAFIDCVSGNQAARGFSGAAFAVDDWLDRRQPGHASARHDDTRQLLCTYAPLGLVGTSSTGGSAAKSRHYAEPRFSAQTHSTSSLALFGRRPLLHFQFMSLSRIGQAPLFASQSLR